MATASNPGRAFYCKTCDRYYATSYKFHIKKEHVEQNHQVFQCVISHDRQKDEVMEKEHSDEGEEDEGKGEEADGDAGGGGEDDGGEDDGGEDDGGEDDGGEDDGGEDDDGEDDGEEDDGGEDDGEEDDGGEDDGEDDGENDGEDDGEEDDEEEEFKPAPTDADPNDPANEFLAIWLRYNLTHEAVKSILAFHNKYGGTSLSFRNVLRAKTALPHPSVLGSSTSRRFALAEAALWFFGHFHLPATPPLAPHPDLSEFCYAEEFLFKAGLAQGTTTPPFRWFPIILFWDDYGEYNGLHTCRPYTAVYLSTPLISHQQRNSIGGWVPLAVIAQPTREKKMALFQAICQEIATQNDPTLRLELFALTGDHVGLSEIAGTVRPGRAIHGCLTCESFGTRDSVRRIPRTPARALEVAAKIKAASSKARALRIQQDSGYRLDSCPAIPLGFDPFRCSLMDLDHTESGHVARFVVSRIVTAPLRNLVIERLRMLQGLLPSECGILPRYQHQKKMSFSELRLLVQLLAPLLWDRLPTQHLIILRAQCRYLAVMYDRFATRSELAAVSSLVQSHRTFLDLCFDKPAESAVNLHSSLCWLPDLIRNFGSPALYRSQRTESLHKFMKKAAAQVAHMSPSTSASWLLINTWHTITIARPAPRPPVLTIGDSEIARDDHLIARDGASFVLLRVSSVDPAGVDGTVFERTSTHPECPMPTFRPSKVVSRFLPCDLLAQAMVLPDVTDKLNATHDNARCVAFFSDGVTATAKWVVSGKAQGDPSGDTQVTPPPSPPPPTTFQQPPRQPSPLPPPDESAETDEPPPPPPRSPLCESGDTQVTPPPPPPLPPPPSPPPPSTPTLDESAGPTRPPPNESAETDEPPPPPPRSPLCESGDTQVTPPPPPPPPSLAPSRQAIIPSSLRPSTPLRQDAFTPGLLEPSPFFLPPPLLPSSPPPPVIPSPSPALVSRRRTPRLSAPGAWSQSEARSKYDLCFPISNIPSQVQSYFFAFNIFHEDLACVRSHDFLPSRFMDVYLRAIRHLFASRTPFDFIPSLCHLQPNARYVCGMPGCRFVACPIHTEVRGGGHFVLFVYDIEDQILFLLDSMRPLQSPAPSECGHLLPLFGVTDYIPLDVARRHQHLGAECLCEVCSYVLFLARRWDEFVMDPDIILADDVTRRVTREDLDLLVTSPETFAAKMVDM
ncbi:hypothetical protein PAPYR_9982 [Paratrimastix pyriformis]|uniref:C2H2-type domain-containing protein n=1 Tax=Paratrimastix pyriformis TaxID=342808 RepID=A0ABQ8UCS8_9EUKA|nr:hypothetical protein PAPYR_9982 [Paratrimastix pyriformis]